MNSESSGEQRLAEVRGLISGLCDGELQPAEVARLEVLIAGDEACCEYYITAIHINAALPRYLGADRRSVSSLVAAQQLLGGDLEASSLVAGSADDGASTTPASTPLPAPGIDAECPLESGLPGASIFSSWSQGSFGLFSVVVAIASVVGGFAVWSDRDRPAVVELGQDQPVASAIAKAADGLPVVTSLTTKESTTTMHLAGIGHVTIEKKTDFQLIGPKRARLNYGRIKMRVTEETGHGFVVETPDGEITDLGTEFGVDVGAGRSSLLAVFEGTVDLQVADQMTVTPHIERLLGGDGVLFNRGGAMNRLDSIRTGELATFACTEGIVEEDANDALIARVYDNLPTTTTRRFYEIVPKGMKEDAASYVDRLEHNWNGLSRGQGMPPYLVGADYVKTFNDDKQRSDKDFQLTIVLNQPARLYILFDKRLTIPKWLSEDFQRTFDNVGLDAGRWTSSETNIDKGHMIDVGPGQSIDQELSVWVRTVNAPGPVTLGPNGGNTNKQRLDHATMYGIVAEKLPIRKSKGPAKKSASAVTPVRTS